MSWTEFLLSIRDKYPLMFAEYTKKSLPEQFKSLPEQKRGKQK